MKKSIIILLIIVFCFSFPVLAEEIQIEDNPENINPEIDDEIYNEAEEITIEEDMEFEDTDLEETEETFVQQEQQLENDNQVEYDLNNPEEPQHDPRVRIGDITRIEGERSNQLMGFGLVTGLAGTGDSGQNEETLQARTNVLQEFGINVSADDLSSSNTAAVIVTADFPPYVNPGDEIDVTVSAWGDADNLQGGTLLQTPLVGADNQVYAVAQGALSIGGFTVRGRRGAQVRENHPTVGTIPGGALVERGLNTQIPENEFSIYLDNPGFETASRIVESINEAYGSQIAQAISPSEIRVMVPEETAGTVDFVAEINNLEVIPDVPARVVINEREGTVAMTHNVRLSTISIQKGDLTMTISPRTEVEHPPPFTPGETVVIEGEEIEIVEDEVPLQVVQQQPTIEDLVMALNQIGATPRDMISIIKEINAAGALHAELELR